MKYTNNLGLKKPESTDFYNLEDFNYNADKIDEELGNLDPVKLLDQIKTVDGEGSGLDADMLDGKHSTAFATSDHKHEMSDINNLNLTAENTTVKDTDNNFVSGTVEGALKELATKDKDLDKRIDDNKTEVDKEIADLKQYGSNVKEGFATVITSKGVTTDSSDTFDTMINNVGSIKTKLPILEGDVGVTEDTEGNVYGVEKIEERQAYPHKRDYIYKWMYRIDESVFRHFSSGITEDFFLLHISKVEKRNSESQKIWEYKLEPSVPPSYSGITTDLENNVYVIMSSQNTKLLKLSSNGNLTFEKTISSINNTQISNLCFKNNYLYISTNKRLLKFSLEGDLIWDYAYSKEILSFDIDINNYIYIVDGSTLTKLNESTDVVWNIATYHDRILIKNDFMYTYSSGDIGYIRLYNIGSGSVIWERQTRKILGVSLDSFGFIYVLLNWLYDNSTPNIIKYDRYSSIILEKRLEGNEIYIDNYASIFLVDTNTSAKYFRKYKDNYTLEKVAVLKEREVN